MTVYERFARLSDRLFDRLRHQGAFTLTDHDALDGDLRSLRGRRYAVVVTFRRSGVPVPSPVWVALDDKGVAYVKTRRDAGKVKRLRRDTRVLIAASSPRGRPLAPAIRATGRVLPASEWAYAEAVLAAGHGVTRRTVDGVLGGPDKLAAYIEIRPRL